MHNAIAYSKRDELYSPILLVRLDIVWYELVYIYPYMCVYAIIVIVTYQKYYWGK